MNYATLKAQFRVLAKPPIEVTVIINLPQPGEPQEIRGDVILSAGPDSCPEFLAVPIEATPA